MLLWFIAIAALGVVAHRRHPEILAALSPHHALGFIWRQPGTAFIILGAVVLCVTGGEALYADMGHFGRRPIRVAWFSIVMPAPDAELLRPGRAAAVRARGGQEPVLPHGARLADAAAGRPGHDGHGDRLAGADQRAPSASPSR
jgi:KUP system potassium uptake protein